MSKRITHWTPAFIAALILTLIPIAAFVGIVVNVVMTSIPAITHLGLKVLFSTKFSNVFSGTFIQGEYGLLPALWGTVLVAIVALVLAFPAALAMAIFASEYTIGRLGDLMETLLALFAGIPPIIYALLSIFVLAAFVRPEFAGGDLSETFIKSLPGLPTWNAGMLPHDTSTFLGGIILSLLIIPFMAPLILDAIRNVPYSLKEASLALGANRWFTLWHVTLPISLSGILSAISLGILTTIGDVIIASWTIGYLKNGMPNPLFDIFEASAPLTSTGAGILSGLRPGSTLATGVDRAASYFTALLLLVLAFVILGLVSALQQGLRRRLK